MCEQFCSDLQINPSVPLALTGGNLPQCASSANLLPGDYALILAVLLFGVDVIAKICLVF